MMRQAEILLYNRVQALQADNWRCAKCACPGKNGYDCLKRAKRGYIISLTVTGFKLQKMGHIVESGHLYQLDAVLKKHELQAE
jgi:hypothetical protein